MKTILILLAGIIALSTQIYAQSLLSPRVGNEIDIVERDYFGLFPSINGFLSAKAVLQSQDSTHFTITSMYKGVAKDTSVLVDTRTVEKVSKYIENFESVRTQDNVVNWSVFKGLAKESPAIGQPFHDPKTTTITLPDGKSITGKLLWADDSTLVVWRSEAPFDWRTVARDANAIQVRTIYKIESDIPVNSLKGMRYGMLSGLGIGTAYIVLQYNELSNAISRGEIHKLYIPFGFMLAGATIGSVIGWIQQPNLQATINGDEANYLPLVSTLSKASIIDSYPPPELVRLINK